VCSPDRQPMSICVIADSDKTPILENCGPSEKLAITRRSWSDVKEVSRPAAWFKTAMSTLRPNITALLDTLLPQVDGSPALQSLVMCSYFIASGMAINQLKMLFAQASNILVPRRPLYHSLRPAAGQD
jgi:hypothetical protein